MVKGGIGFAIAPLIVSRECTCTPMAIPPVEKVCGWGLVSLTWHRPSQNVPSHLRCLWKIKRNIAEDYLLGAPQSCLTASLSSTQRSVEWWRPTSMEAWMPFSHPPQALTVYIWMVHKFLTNHHGSTFGAIIVGDIANPTSQRADSCPCTAQGTTSTVPSVIGSDYYCSSGNRGSSDSSSVVHSSPLWRTSGPSCVWLHLLWQLRPTLVQEEADTACQWRCGDALVRRWATNQRSYSHYSRRALHPCGQRLNIAICTGRCVQQACELLYTTNWII